MLFKFSSFAVLLANSFVWDVLVQARAGLFTFVWLHSFYFFSVLSLFNCDHTQIKKNEDIVLFMNLNSKSMSDLWTNTKMRNAVCSSFHLFFLFFVASIIFSTWFLFWKFPIFHNSLCVSMFFVATQSIFRLFHFQMVLVLYTVCTAHIFYAFFCTAQDRENTAHHFVASLFPTFLFLSFIRIGMISFIFYLFPISLLYFLFCFFFVLSILFSLSLTYSLFSFHDIDKNGRVHIFICNKTRWKIKQMAKNDYDDDDEE